MPIWFNPFASLVRSEKPPPPPVPSVPSVTVPPAPAPLASVTQAGLFDTSALVTDGPLVQLRQAAPPVNVSELSTNDPRNNSVVYKSVSGRGVRLNHGAVIEGSVDFGGLQPNYVIDLKHPRLQRLLGAARSLNAPTLSFEHRIREVVDLVQRTLTQGAYDAPGYLHLLNTNRSTRTNITLGDYLTQGVGVCRENALLTHLALLEAGVDSEYLYCSATQGGIAEDHAVALAVDEQGRKVVVDSYNRNFHGFFLDDLLRAGGSQATDQRLRARKQPSMFGCALTVAAYPVYWIPVRALLAPLPPMPPIDDLRDFRVVRPAIS
jgi:hypothetical protein